MSVNWIKENTSVIEDDVEENDDDEDNDDEGGPRPPYNPFQSVACESFSQRPLRTNDGIRGHCFHIYIGGIVCEYRSWI